MRQRKQKISEALKMLAIGTPVNVRKDNGDIFETKTRSEPWQLGHGDWVVSVEGISGGYDLERVSIREAVASAV